MASYNVAATEHGAYNKTLVASTVDTVTFAAPQGKVTVWTDGAATITVTVDGTTPTVDGAGGWWLPAQSGTLEIKVPAKYATANLAVKLISSGAPKYSVWGD